MKKIRKKKIAKFFLQFSENFFRRNLSYDEQITRAKLHDHRSSGYGDIRADKQTHSG